MCVCVCVRACVSVHMWVVGEAGVILCMCVYVCANVWVSVFICLYAMMNFCTMWVNILFVLQCNAI